MKNVLSILISVLVLSGCLSLNTYVDPNYSHASYEDVRSIPQKYDVQTVVEFQRDGKPLERVNKEVLGHVDRTLRATGVIIPKRDASNISLKVIVNNIPKSGAAASGFLTGLTFGAVGTLATDYYEVTVVYKDNQGAAITKNYKHALHTTIGNASAPFPDVQPTSMSDGFATIIEQVLLSFVTDMQNNDFLTNSPNTDQLVKLAPKETPDIDSESNSGEMVSAIEYYGEAEEEVNTKSYDKNLWARALVEAEGDEQKRKAKYIELRGNQLYSENVSSISKSNLNEQPVPGTDISGTYIAETTTSGGGQAYQVMRAVKKMNGKLIVLKQTGNTITGSVSSQSNWIKGTREGNIINFYILSWDNQIDGVWKVNADASRFEGKWKTRGGGGASGKWNLTKIDADVASVPDISGTYSAYVTGDLERLMKRNKKTSDLLVRIVQKGSDFEGSYENMDGYNMGAIWGEIKGDTIKFHWQSTKGSDGTGKWTFNSENNEASGKWAASTWYGEGKWNMTKIE